ncbi:molybdopterin-dependent oxidoreductase [Desulfovibrio sp. UIB00]|uniref:DMSO/selenate family reductase complex A subunit n=1 Tax=Desulfovibrio sp. UIB00 TaxID=2804314 RepID=UPI001F0D34F3|nr:DMSO/selenate family reductase complex A subunit [Desulfovibrio sp. UIB00]MCH5143723.1 molybdopterin-dependent oxidoreductase [Desulfovibrio sp. UIB00]
MSKKNPPETAPGGEITRRCVLKWVAALGGLAAGGGLFYGLNYAVSAPAKDGKTIWTSCNVNCGSRCLLRAHVADGVVTRIDSDTKGDSEYGLHEIRACLRGRSMRHRLYAPDRLKYPMKRVGARGEGKFERISWEQALDEISARLKKTIADYGNDAVYINYGTGNLGATLSISWPTGNTPLARLMNCLGGYLNMYGTYSTSQISQAMPFMYGEYLGNNALSDIANTKLAVFFGNNPVETRMSGGGMTYDLMQAKQKGNARIVVIDPRYTDTAAVADEWIPIRPGTDAALVSGMAHVLITENMVDTDFLKRCTVGYDEDSLPEGIPAGNSYKAYILGHGEDKTPKTPRWASAITGIPEDKIISLAREIGGAKPCYICQGWASQRHANGEQTSRAITMMAMLTGNMGLQGGSTGAREGSANLPVAVFPFLTNPVKKAISVFSWTEAIKRGAEMTALRDGVRGADKLDVPIKFMWNYAGNAIINQHSDANETSRILKDESLLETLVVIDNFLTPSAKFADYLLPGTFNLEEDDIIPQGSSSQLQYVIFAQKAVEPFFESRSIYDICTGIAERFGVQEKYTEGRTRDAWLRKLYDDTRKKIPELPATVEEAFSMGVLKRKAPQPPVVPYKAFRDNPEANPLKTPTGKVEIFSKKLWDIGHTWELPEGDRITALPEYLPTWEGVSDPLRSKYPLQLIGHHYKQRTHSTYGNVDWLKKVAPQELWINPVDAEKRGLKAGDTAKVFNDRGTVFVPVKVTPRIMPGVLSLPQGAWYEPDAKGQDHGGCVNVLTSLRPSPLSKGNPQHTNLVEVVKV